MNIVSEIKKSLKVAANNCGFQVDSVDVETTNQAIFGDYTSNLALRLASFNTIGSQNNKKLSEKSKMDKSKTQQSPQEIAKKLIGSLDNSSKEKYFKKVEVAGPGFINFYLSDNFLRSQLKEIILKREDFSKNEVGKGKKASVEFVSANPTGPLHIGNARGGPLGDVICNILIYSGYSVQKEFYVNDEGGQILKFGKTLLWLSMGSEFVSNRVKNDNKAEDKEYELEYKGKYMNALADNTKKEVLKGYSVDELSEITLDNLSVLFGKTGAKIQVEEILSDLKNIGIDYDKLYFESFFAANKTTKIIDLLTRKGFVIYKEGAKWFVANKKMANMDLDRESVLVKTSGELTYFANDIAFHDEKFKQNPSLVINVLGSGHHGHLSRLNAAIAALGYDPKKYQVVLYQNVAVKKGGKIVKMSKREGNFLAAAEVLDEIGKDAFRFFMLMHDPSTHMDLDISLARKKSADNPVYYVQYAHARIASILAKTKIKAESGVDLSVLENTAETALVKSLIKLPILVEKLSQNFAVHQLTYYGVELADSFHRFYENCRVISDDKKLTSARLQLVAATGIIIRMTLGLLGVSAPEKM